MESTVSSTSFALAPRFAMLSCLLIQLAVWPAQDAPYDAAPVAEAPYYRVRLEADTSAGGLRYPVQFTVWVPPRVDRLRGVVVHQHGCGPGSCQSGLTGAYDLHWQALAAAHDCALLAAVYEQPDKTGCVAWCDPRNGSDAAFQAGLKRLADRSGHPELAEVPWALWGHSGGAYWSGAMTLLHPDRVVAAWLRSGVPTIERDETREIDPFPITAAARSVPIACNLGTREGVTDRSNKFATVWPGVQAFAEAMRADRDAPGVIAVSVDPNTSHECGDQRYLAIPWFDACLTQRLDGDGKLRPVEADAWVPVPAAAEGVETTVDFGRVPTAELAAAWSNYVNGRGVTDRTPPPPAANVRWDDSTLRFDAVADRQSGLRAVRIESGGQTVATVPTRPSNRFGRPLFQGLQYSDTPANPLQEMSATLPADLSRLPLRLRTVNTAGQVSTPVDVPQP